MPADKKIIQVDLKPERLGRRAKLELGLCGNIKDTIAALLPIIETKQDDTFLMAQLALYEKVKENLNIYVKDSGESHKISPEYVAHTIDRLADRNAIFTVDTGVCCVWGARYLNATGA